MNKNDVIYRRLYVVKTRQKYLNKVNVKVRVFMIIFIHHKNGR